MLFPQFETDQFFINILIKDMRSVFENKLSIKYPNDNDNIASLYFLEIILGGNQLAIDVLKEIIIKYYPQYLEKLKMYIVFS